jgi:hypothetical protein
LFFLYRDILDNQLVCAACDCNRSETNHNCKAEKSKFHTRTLMFLSTYKAGRIKRMKMIIPLNLLIISKIRPT